MSCSYRAPWPCHGLRWLPFIASHPSEIPGWAWLIPEASCPPSTQPQGGTCRFLLVLENLLDLLIAADLFHALPLDGALAQLLQELIGTREAFQDRMGILGLQKH